MKEGERTKGVWLPIALADIFAALLGVIRVTAANGDKLKIPKRGETLRGWWLPIMAEAIEGDEAEQEAFALLKSVEDLAKKQSKQ